VRFAASSISGFGETVTGPVGTFEIRLPGHTETVSVAVLAIGMPIYLGLLRASDDARPQQVTIGATAGKLFVPMTADFRAPVIGSSGGVMFPMRALIFPPDGSPAMPQGIGEHGFAISLAPGVYVVCPRPDDCGNVVIRAGEQTSVKPVLLDEKKGK
jgi:hypothetical protein